MSLGSVGNEGRDSVSLRLDDVYLFTQGVVRFSVVISNFKALFAFMPNDVDIRKHWAVNYEA